MIKFEVRHRWSGDVKFTAEIDCAEDAPHRLPDDKHPVAKITEGWIVEFMSLIGIFEKEVA